MLKSELVKNSDNLINFNNILGSPCYRNFFIENYKKLVDMHQKLSDCGYNEVEFINKSTSEIVNFPVFL